MTSVLQVIGVHKDYGRKGFRTKVLKGIDLTVEKDDFIL